MCGIPMRPAPDAARGRKLTLEQALRHIGGAENFISGEGRAMIRNAAQEYIWKYPDGTAWCTACGGRIEGLKMRQNARVCCPKCGREALFKNEAKGHKRVYDKFFLYEWRKSETDREAVVLTVAHVWRDSTGPRPEREPLRVSPCALYLFRPGKAATVYKGSLWGDGEPIDGRSWFRTDRHAPEHTKLGWGTDIVVDYMQFRNALEGTRIGATFDLLNRRVAVWETLELTAIANCARRPFLEYLAKAGQPDLAAELMRMAVLPKDLIPRPQARKPAELLGLTEGQWYEARRDGIKLTTELLTLLGALRRLDAGDWTLAEARDICRAYKYAGSEIRNYVLPDPATKRWRNETVCELLDRAGVSGKPRRKALRRIARDARHAMEWRDYYDMALRLKENLNDTALLLPKDMAAMHDRMSGRLQALRDEEEARKLAEREAQFAGRLAELRKKYSFAACGLVLRPYESAKEVLAEGRALNICIGSYAGGYLEGRCVICCLRKADAPDTPWRAVEFGARDGRLVQDRGKGNDRGGIDGETAALLKEFWAAFNEKRRRTA